MNEKLKPCPFCGKTAKVFSFSEGGICVSRTMTNSYGFCVYHGIECDYEGICPECPHNTKEDAEWFEAESEE